MDTKYLTLFCKSANLRYFRTTSTFSLSVTLCTGTQLSIFGEYIEPSPVTFPFDVTISTLKTTLYQCMTYPQAVALGTYHVVTLFSRQQMLRDSIKYYLKFLPFIPVTRVI